MYVHILFSTYSSVLSSIYTDRLNCTSNRIGRRTVRRMCDKPLAYRGDLAAVFEVCPLAKEIGYRQFCSRPEWQEAKEFQVWKDPVLGSVFRTCNVTNLASKVPDAYWCNGVYNCVDRADEAECETITTQDARMRGVNIYPYCLINLIIMPVSVDSG